VEERSDRSQDVLAALRRDPRSRKQPLEPAGIAAQEPTEELGRVAADQREAVCDRNLANDGNSARLVAQ
jgi:hypothetical protein